MTDASSCLCQNVTRSWRDKPEPPFPLNIYEVPGTSACLAQEVSCSGVAMETSVSCPAPTVHGRFALHVSLRTFPMGHPRGPRLCS